MSLTKEDIIEEVASYMHTYLKEGRLSIQPFLKDLSINIDSLKDLLKIKFLLQENTESFVEKMPGRLRRFKTTTISSKELVHNDIRGRILWQDTYQERYKSGNDSTIYITSKQNRSYDTDENLVLKETLVIIEQLLYKDKLYNAIEKMSWGVQWKELSLHVKHALHKNSYIERVTFQQTTRKQRLRASQHRLPLYREAANVLKNYYRLMRGEYTTEELKDILYNTFIMTDNEDTLMELYWTIQLIKERTSKETYFMISEGQTKVAEWRTADSLFIVSHNTSGPKDLLFSISFDELQSINHPIIKQLIRSKGWSEYYSREIFGTGYGKGFWSGRPDILIEKRNTESNRLEELIIGEVKNTSQTQYAKEGLWELSEYIYLLRDRNNQFLKHGLSIKGILCLGDLKVNETQFEELEIKSLFNRKYL